MYQKYNHLMEHQRQEFHQIILLRGENLSHETNRKSEISNNFSYINVCEYVCVDKTWNEI